MELVIEHLPYPKYIWQNTTLWNMEEVEKYIYVGNIFSKHNDIRPSAHTLPGYKSTCLRESGASRYMGFLTDSDHARVVMHSGIPISRFPSSSSSLKSMAGKKFLVFPPKLSVEYINLRLKFQNVFVLYATSLKMKCIFLVKCKFYEFERKHILTKYFKKIPHFHDLNQWMI